MARAEATFSRARAADALNGDYEWAQALQAKGAMSKEEIARITGDRTERRGRWRLTRRPATLPRST